MATAIAALQTAWETEIAKISDTLINAKATFQLDGYIAAVQQQASLEAKDIASYSIGSRTFTYRDVNSGAAAIQSLEDSLHDMVYGRTNLVDFNTRITEST
jgi:hypothetical protein